MATAAVIKDVLRRKILREQLLMQREPAGVSLSSFSEDGEKDGEEAVWPPNKNCSKIWFAGYIIIGKVHSSATQSTSLTMVEKVPVPRLAVMISCVPDPKAR